MGGGGGWPLGRKEKPVLKQEVLLVVGRSCQHGDAHSLDSNHPHPQAPSHSVGCIRRGSVPCNHCLMGRGAPASKTPSLGALHHSPAAPCSFLQSRGPGVPLDPPTPSPQHSLSPTLARSASPCLLSPPPYLAHCQPLLWALHLFPGQSLQPFHRRPSLHSRLILRPPPGNLGDFLIYKHDFASQMPIQH